MQRSVIGPRPSPEHAVQRDWSVARSAGFWPFKRRISAPQHLGPELQLDARSSTALWATLPCVAEQMGGGGGSSGGKLGLKLRAVAALLARHICQVAVAQMYHNGTLVNGTNHKNLRNPSSSILSNTQVVCKWVLDECASGVCE